MDKGTLSEAYGRAAASAKRQQDFDDLQNELSGLETGRAKRFLTAEQQEARKAGRSGDGRVDAMSRLQLLLASDAAYAALYKETMIALDSAERATERSLSAAALALTKAKEHHQHILDRAARLPDGTIVFRDAAGQIRSADGDLVSVDDAAAIQWHGGEPGFEEHVQAKGAVEASMTAQSELGTYQVDVLGRIRDRMSDDANPPSPEELEVFQRDIVEQMPDLQVEGRANDSVSVPTPKTPTSPEIPVLP